MQTGKACRSDLAYTDVGQGRKLQSDQGARLTTGRTNVRPTHFTCLHGLIELLPKPNPNQSEKSIYSTYVSNLRRFIEAMGGQLDIRAHFPEVDVRIKQFEELEDKH